MPKPLNASIIIPVWNRVTLTGDRFLDLDPLYRIRHDFEIVVINNGSTDRTRELLKWWKNNSDWRLTIKHLPENVGFGPANNLGVLSSKADVIILLSNDVVIDGDFIEPLLAALLTNERSICAPRIIDWPAGWNEFPPEPPIPYAEGWLLAMKRSTWGKIGGFDRRFAPCDYEDIDLSFTAVKKGFSLKQVNVPVQHIGAGTLGYTQERRAITDNHRRLFAEKWGLQWTPVR